MVYKYASKVAHATRSKNNNISYENLTEDIMSLVEGNLGTIPTSKVSKRSF
jgi:hypothetical protein